MRYQHFRQNFRLYTLLPPRPTINPLLIKDTPPGNEPDIVKAGVPVDDDCIVPVLVAVNSLLPSHPFDNAVVLKLTSVPPEKLNEKAPAPPPVPTSII